MKVETILENTSLVLSEEHLNNIRVVLDRNPTLPMHLNGKTLHFKDYTIGEFRAGDLVVNIKPRNDAFKLEDFFRILQFIDRPLQSDLQGYGFDNSQSMFNLSDISREFCFVCSKLLQFGLTGSYRNHSLCDRKVQGEILFSEYKKQLIPINGIPFSDSIFTINIPANQVIKSALVKLIRAEREDQNSEKYQISRDLDFIDEVDFNLYEVGQMINGFYSSNPFYLPALELASRILFSLELEYKDGNIEWLAFLENSNAIFESYILKVLDLFIEEPVMKWDMPKNFARLNLNERWGEKSFSPDIVVNYNKREESAMLVLDVKNKTFEPSKNISISDLVSSSDLYQMMFYCRQLKTNLGGLIYPSTTTNKPVRITLETDNNLQIYLFSINMNSDMDSRHSRLAQDIKENLLAKA